MVVCTYIPFSKYLPTNTTKNLIQKCILRIICIQFSSSSISSSSSCAELMCLMLKGSRVCKTQGRSYPPQMEYCVRVYEFLKSWNSNCRCKPALQLQAQASCIIRHTRSRSTDKVSHQRGPLCTLSWCLLLYNCLSPNNHTKAFPKWPKLFGINKPFPPCWSRLCTHPSVAKL